MTLGSLWCRRDWDSIRRGPYTIGWCKAREVGRSLYQILLKEIFSEGCLGNPRDFGPNLWLAFYYQSSYFPALLILNLFIGL